MFQNKNHASIRNKKTRLYLQKIPEWLFSVKNVGEYHGINIKRWRINNWDKFILHSNSIEAFSGLINIEVCNSSLIINYKPTEEICFIDFNELEAFLKKDEENTRKMFITIITNLEQLGFEFEKKEPLWEVIEDANVH